MNEEVTQGKAARGGGLGLYISFLHPKKEKKKQFCGGETAEHVKGQRLDLLSTFCVFVDLRTCTGSQLCPVLSSSG